MDTKQKKETISDKLLGSYCNFVCGFRIIYHDASLSSDEKLKKIKEMDTKQAYIDGAILRGEI